MPGFRAHCAAATVLMLLVSTVGPSAAAAAELIRGISGCVTSPGPGCPPPPGPADVLPDTTNLAGGLPSSTSSPLPGGTSSLTSSLALPGSSSVTTGTSGISTLPATPTTTDPLPSTVPPLPTVTDSPTGDEGGSGGGGAEGGSDGNPGDGNPGDGNPGHGNPGGDGGGTCGDGVPAADAVDDGSVTAATKLHWGNPTRVENFDTDLGDWGVYDSVGHDGNGLRRPDAATVSGGLLTITGDAGGTSAGMAWKPGSTYGRWEVRMRAPVSDPDYHAVALLWPDAENWPVGGEVDFVEMSDPTRQTTDGFLHYGAGNAQEHGCVDIDATRWHNWAVEWTPTGITYYVDGTPWFHTADTSHLPPGPMHLTLQLDLFRTGGGLRPSQMLVDWTAFYPVAGSVTPTSTPISPPPNSPAPSSSPAVATPASRSAVRPTPPATSTAGS